MNCIIEWEVYHQVNKTQTKITFEPSDLKGIIDMMNSKGTRPSPKSEESSRTEIDDSGDIDPDDGETIR
jgi:hypothetical protein